MFNQKQYNKKYYQEHKETAKEYYIKNKKKIKEYFKKYQQEHKEYYRICNKKYNTEHNERIKKDKKIYRQENIIKIKEYDKIYRENHKEEKIKYRQDHRKQAREYSNEYLNKKYKEDTNFKIKTNLRNRLYQALKKNFKSGHTLELLGCSIKFLREHLEKQFKVGMNWDNYGLWHIDHIRPCASFDFSKPEEQARCFNYTNLRPLWAKENLEKSDKII